MGETIQPLAVGDVVYYVAYGTPNGEYQSTTRAAIVTEFVTTPKESSWEGVKLNLAVLNPTGIFFNTNVPYGTSGGHWHFR